jgi:DNA invertase Pin-like site-specific DNA recombinase
MIRAAIYLRVSTLEQAHHGYSIQAQKEALVKYVQEHDMLMEDVKQGKIDIILFIKLDRWFRSVRDYYKIQDILDKHNVNWKTIFEDYDTTTASGRLHINIMLSVAQDESDRTSERIKFVFENKVKRKEVISGSLPVGLKIENQHIIHDEEKKYIPIAAFNHYETHQSIFGTTSYLRDTLGVNMPYITVSRMLHNPLYKGKHRTKEDDFCEPLISPKQFDKVQEMMKRRSFRKTKNHRVFIFTGLLTCADCGGNMTTACAIKPNKEYFYYRCYKAYVRKTCPRKNYVDEDYVEQYLLNNIEQEINKLMANHELASKAKVIKPKINAAQIKNKLSRLKELYVNYLIEMDDYKRDFEKYNNQLRGADAIPVQDKIDIERLKEFMQSNFKTIYVTLTKSEKRVLWRNIIKEIKIDREKNMQIFFN